MHHVHAIRCVCMHVHVHAHAHAHGTCTHGLGAHHLVGQLTPRILRSLAEGGLHLILVDVPAAVGVDLAEEPVRE